MQAARKAVRLWPRLAWRALAPARGLARSSLVSRLWRHPRWPARLRRTAVGAPAFFRSSRRGVPPLLSPGVELGRQDGWGCGLSCSKIPLSYCICEIFIVREFRRTQPANRFVINFFAKFDADTRIFREFSRISWDLSVTAPDQLHFLHFLVFSLARYHSSSLSLNPELEPTSVTRPF